MGTPASGVASAIGSAIGTAASTATSPWLAIINTIAKPLIDLIPDPQKKLEAQQHIVDQQFALVQFQLQVDNTEAASKSLFVAGWRPAFGWVGAAGLGYQMVLRPLLTFTVALFGAKWQAPSIEIQDLITLVGTMLGFGAMRSYDKTQAADNGH